jgi:hypothetical protein
LFDGRASAPAGVQIPPPPPPVPGVDFATTGIRLTGAQARPRGFESHPLHHRFQAWASPPRAFV